MSWGWFDEAGRPGTPPDELTAYLDRVVPMVEQVRDTGEAPADLYWAPALPRLIANLADVLRRPGSLGFAMFVDYGDATIDGIDTDDSRLRVYAADQVHGRDPYRSPGTSDLTWDVDFGEVGRLARRHGLRVRFAGPQAALEVPPVDLASPAALDRLVPGRVAEGATHRRSRSGGRAAAGERVPVGVERVPRDDARTGRRALPGQRLRAAPTVGLITPGGPMTDASSPERSPSPCAAGRTEAPQLDALRDEPGSSPTSSCRATSWSSWGRVRSIPAGRTSTGSTASRGRAIPTTSRWCSALHDPETGVRGVLISAYGPAASAGRGRHPLDPGPNPSCA